MRIGMIDGCRTPPVHRRFCKMFRVCGAPPLLLSRPPHFCRQQAVLACTRVVFFIFVRTFFSRRCCISPIFVCAFPLILVCASAAGLSWFLPRRPLFLESCFLRFPLSWVFSRGVLCFFRAQYFRLVASICRIPVLLFIGQDPSRYRHGATTAVCRVREHLS